MKLQTKHLSYHQYCKAIDAEQYNYQNTIANNPVIPLIIEHIYGWKAIYLAVTAETKTIAFVAGNLYKNKFISLPHFSYAAWNITNEYLPRQKEVFNQLALSIGAIEIRSFEQLTENSTQRKVSSFLKLETNPTDQLVHLKASVRRKIRKSQKNQLKIRKQHHNTDKTKTTTDLKISGELLQDFYQVYRANMKRLGSPHLSWTFFESLLRKYSNGQAGCYVVYYMGKPIGAAISLSHNSVFENCWFASLREYNHLYTSYFLHWHMMTDAIAQKCHIYSFGRSTAGSGTHIYKKQWGSYDQLVYWNQSMPAKLDPRNMQILSTAWKYLPAPITNWLGPAIAKRIV